MKVKIGAQLEDEVYHELKMVAARQRRSISDVIQLALTDYFHQSRGSSQHRAGLKRMLDRAPLKVTEEQFHEALELDYFDQI
jgi:hypothetical protein